MARNEEKSQSMLNRFLQMKSEERKKPRERRPFLASDCKNLLDAERWRSEVLREIGKRVSEIQNEGLGEHRIRDLNDEINKFLREKAHWERRIIELGGQNYLSQAPKIFDDEGQAIEGSTYKYFGAAKKLPGVKDLFYTEAPPPVKRTRADMYRSVDADYYGWRDDEDGRLKELEQEAQRKAVENTVTEWKANKKQKVEALGQHNMKCYDVNESDSEEEQEKEQQVVPVSAPSKEEMEKTLLKKRKDDLMKRYLSEDLRQTLNKEEHQIKVVRGTSV